MDYMTLNTSIHDAPSQWNGPHMWTNLKTLVRDNSNKPLLFDTFEEAVTAANKIDECSGITYSDKGYRLFKGNHLVKNKENTQSAIASWVKDSKYKSKKTKKKKLVLSGKLNSGNVNSGNVNSGKVNSSGKMSKKANSKSYIQNNWVNYAFKDTKFKIIETLSNGDCFFDSIRLGLPSSHKKSVSELRFLLLDHLNEDIFERDLDLYTKAKQNIEISKNIKKDIILQPSTSKTQELLIKIDNDINGSYETINEWNFFEKYKLTTFEKYKEFILTNNYWANSWSLSIIEKELNIKLILLNERSYNEDDTDNILWCGDMEVNIDAIPSCIVCGMTQRDREFLDSEGDDDMKIEIYKNALVNHSIDISEDDTLDILKQKYSELPDSHKFVDKEEEEHEEYVPNGYIIVTYSGNHYRLVSYNNKSFFTILDEVPRQLVQQIKRKCNDVGLYKRIKGIGI